MQHPQNGLRVEWRSRHSAGPFAKVRAGGARESKMRRLGEAASH